MSKNNEYPLYNNSDKCPTARYVGGVSRSLCECKTPSECEGVKLVGAKFKVGDRVNFVNDYGIKFPNKIVRKIELINNEPRYHIEPTDTPWFPSYERNLRLMKI